METVRKKLHGYILKNMGEKSMRIGSREFDTQKKTYVMGILNVTPDSFSDGGKYSSVDQALRQAEHMVLEGADVIDIGGESTRPGYTKISEEEEIERVVPVIRAVRKHFDVPISLDTYKSEVARAGLDAGAALINDIWGLKQDEKMAEVIAEYDAACCLMHNRKEADYRDLIADMILDLEESIRLAKEAGIRNDGILLDPGIGFAKTYEDNLRTLNNLETFSRLDYPLLLGTSRKSVIGLTLHADTGDRVIGTAVTTVFAVMHHCAFVRVHDIKENVQAIRMTEAILNAGGRQGGE